MTGLPITTVLLDDGTGTFPHDITGYVRLSEGISIVGGRQNEQSEPTTGTLRLTLNNGDGRFTPGSTTIATPSPIVLNQQIRVKLTVGSTTIDRFTGNVQEWVVGWPAGVTTHSTVEVVATDALARLGRVPASTPLTDVLLLDGATLVYPLTDPQPTYTLGDVVPACYPVGSYAETAGPLWAMIESAEISELGFSSPAFASVEMPNGNGFVVAQSTVGGSFGIHPYRIGQNSSANVASGPGVSAASTYTVGVAFKVPPATDGHGRIAEIMTLGTIPTGPSLSLGVWSYPDVSAPEIQFRINDGSGPASVLAPGFYADDKWHYASMVVTNSGKTLTAYLDGVLVGSNTAAGAMVGTLSAFRLLYNDPLLDGDPVAAGYLSFTPAALTATQVATHAEVAIGAAGFRTDEVVSRYADIAGVAFTALGEGASRVPTFAGPTVADITTDALSTERGRLYVDGSGVLTFEPRDYFLTDVYAGTPDITGQASVLAPNASFSLDPQRMVNRADVTRQGGPPIIRENAASIAQNGVYGDPLTIQAMTDSDAENLAAYLLWLYLEPGARVAGATVNLYGQSQVVQEAFLISLLGAWLRLTGLPSQSPTGSTADLYIEGFTETISGDTWSLSLNTAAKLEDESTWWRLDDANFPLGTNTHPFY